MAEDLTQETLLRALQAVRGGKRLPLRRAEREAWLYRIATNIVNDHFRKLKRRKEVRWTDLNNPGAHAGKGRPSNGEADVDAYLDILEKLAGKDLIDLVRMRLAGLSNAEMAAKEGVDERTIERRWQRLREIVQDSTVMADIFF